MKLRIPLQNRRILIAANYLFLMVMLVLFHLGETGGWNVMVVSGAIAGLLIALGTFVIVHLKTHLWKMSHANSDDLDEREFQVVHSALGYSYSIFTVVVIIILYVLTLAEVKGAGTLGILLPASLLYLAHSLPSAVLGWTERVI